MPTKNDMTVHSKKAITRLSPDTISSAFTQALSELSVLGTALFVSAVGLQAGLGIQKASKKEAVLAALLGASMVAMGFLDAI